MFIKVELLNILLQPYNFTYGTYSLLPNKSIE